MKWVSFILSICILGLSARPCDDLTTCFKQKISSTSSNHAHHSKDDCSPFCNCACCTTGTVANFLFNPLAIITAINIGFSSTIKNPATNTPFISNFYKNIWQPPKV